MLKKYIPPSFASKLPNPPEYTLQLANIPTPIFRWKNVPGLPEDFPLYIKRDDFTGAEWSGNKIRKLNFLLADALKTGADTVVTLGGTQSNHCRATVAACRQVGLEPYVILREDFKSSNGNVLLENLMGAHINVVSTDEYFKKGSVGLLNEFTEALKGKGRKPYPIWIGGSVPLGTWGYIDMVRELVDACSTKEASPFAVPLSDVVVSTGSGSTLAGTALGCHLAHAAKVFPKVNVRGFSVSDNPDWFFQKLNTLYSDLGVSLGDARTLCSIFDARGIGYAKATTEELQFLSNVARNTGVILDPAYTNKAVMKMVQQLQAKEFSPSGACLYIHTGGLASIFDRQADLELVLRGELLNAEGSHDTHTHASI